MFYVSEAYTTPPESCSTPLQQQVYESLAKLKIPYQRVDTQEAITMEDCVAINEKLDMRMVKTLFLCNRKQTEFYLFVTAGDKPFKSKEFSAAMGTSRVSFAPTELMDKLLGTKIGAATVFSALLDSADDVEIVIDKDVANEEWYGCSDGTTTGYMKVRTKDILDKFLPYAGREATICKV